MSIEIRFKNSDEESYNIQEQDWMIRRIILRFVLLAAGMIAPRLVELHSHEATIHHPFITFDDESPIAIRLLTAARSVPPGGAP